MEETMALIERSHHGDKEARDCLVQENMGLVWSIVRRFTGRGTDTEDLFQIGAMGLIKAIDKFDPSFQVKFSTYAVPMIAGEIKRFLRDDGMVKVSRTLKENSWKIKKAEDQYRQKTGREPTVGELAELTGLTPEEIVQARILGWRWNPFTRPFPRVTEVRSAFWTGWEAGGRRRNMCWTGWCCCSFWKNCRRWSGNSL